MLACSFKQYLRRSTTLCFARETFDPCTYIHGISPQVRAKTKTGVSKEVGVGAEIRDPIMADGSILWCTMYKATKVVVQRRSSPSSDRHGFRQIVATARPAAYGCGGHFVRIMVPHPLHPTAHRPPLVSIFVSALCHASLRSSSSFVSHSTAASNVHADMHWVVWGLTPREHLPRPSLVRITVFG